MEKILQDVRYAVRSFFRQPSFALTAILTLALGIGATTAIFSVVSAVVLKPLPFHQADRVVAVTNFWTRSGLRGGTVSAPDFHDWKAQSGSFKSFAYHQGARTASRSTAAPTTRGCTSSRRNSSTSLARAQPRDGCCRKRSSPLAGRLRS